MCDGSVVARNVFGRLPVTNPFVGTFHHAPCAGNRGAAFFTNEIVGMGELEERKKYRHHPLTGMFHLLPGYYDPLHRLCEFRNNDEYNQDTASTDTASVQSMDTHTEEKDPILHEEQEMDRSSLQFKDINDKNTSYYEVVKDANNNIYAYVENVIVPEEKEDEISNQYEPFRTVSLPMLHTFEEEDEEEDKENTLEEKYKIEKSLSTPSSVSKFSIARKKIDQDMIKTNGMIKSISSPDLNSLSISGGKYKQSSMYRKAGFRLTHHDCADVWENDAKTSFRRKKKFSPHSPPTNSNWQSFGGRDLNLEYTQTPPQIPMNPFVARRLNDGEELRVVALNRHGGRRENAPQVLNPNEYNEYNANDNDSHPAPYFIHEKAVTEQYELCGEDQLGDGSYAVVKPGKSRKTGKEVAIKQIHKRFLRTEQAKQAVDREIEIHLRLQYKHIVRLYEVYETDDFLYLVMAKATKGNLKSLMHRKRQLPEALAAKLVQQIMRAIYFLHEKGVVHCDIKPENILLSEAKSSNTGSGNFDSQWPSMKRRNTMPGRVSPTESTSTTSNSRAMAQNCDVKVCELQVELCDFGLAVKVPDARYYKHTGDVHKVPFTELPGTPGYIAPELLQRQSYGKPVDLWSVGIIIYEMMSGYQPFYPPNACINEAVVFDSRVWNNVSAEAKDLVVQLLESDPSKRITAGDALSHPWFDTATFAI